MRTVMRTMQWQRPPWNESLKSLERHSTSCPNWMCPWLPEFPTCRKLWRFAISSSMDTP
jgi:hypothetical protein